VQQFATAVVDDSEQVVQAALRIGLAGEVQDPKVVKWVNLWRLALEIAAQALDFIAVPLQELVNVGFADSDFTGGGKAAVADVGDGTAAGFGHPRLELEDFGLEPFGLLRGVGMVATDGVRVVAAARE